MSKGTRVKESIIKAAAEIAKNYETQGLFDVGIGERLPKESEIIDVLNEIKR